jgi:aminopeptidase Y
MVGNGRLMQLAGGLAILTGVSSLQIPLESDQVPLGAPAALKRKLVSTEALQASIKSDNLLARAKELYEVAKLGEEEYNHPTRVIGSDGECN